MWILLVTLLFEFFVPIPNVRASDSITYFPMTHYDRRITIKPFGIHVTNDFYTGKENLFPYNRFYGYHAGVDLEPLPEEVDSLIPVYAVQTGPVTYIGDLSGYGGIILQSLPNGYTALYGHIKTKGLSFRIGDTVSSGSLLTYLGDPFSTQTSRERQHLHLGIYRGTDRYFRGHESTRQAVDAKWLDPTLYLKNNNAVDPQSSPAIPPSEAHPQSSLLLRVIPFIQYTMNTLMNKIPFVPIVLLILAGVGIALFFTTRPSQKPAGLPSGTRPAGGPTTTPAVVDNQAAFAIFTYGTFRVFTAAMYHNRSADVFITAVNPNIVQIKKTDLRWKDFFATLPFTLTQTCLITGTKETFCTSNKGTLSFYLNGEEIPDLLDHRIRHGDRVLITYGKHTPQSVEQEFARVPSIQ